MVFEDLDNFNNFTMATDDGTDLFFGNRTAYITNNDESSNVTNMTNVTAAIYNTTVVQTDTADFHRYVENSCSKAASQIIAVWFIQLLTNLSNLTANPVLSSDNGTSVGDQQQQFSHVLDSPQMALLKDAVVKFLSENEAIQVGVANALAGSGFSKSDYNSTTTPMKNNSNIFFLLAMGIFIYLMQSGFALMEIGMVRTKNAANSIWKNVFYSFSSALGYWLFGMALSFGNDNGTTSHRFAGSTYWAFSDMPTATGQSIDLMLFFFEYVFCTTSGAIMTGAIAERAQIACYIVYTFLTASFTYPIVVHWAWAADGWLKYGSLYNINGKDVRIGFEDFAGSGVVHSCGGVAALIAVIFVGPRIGRFTPDGKVNEINGHSLTFVATGALTLFTGFLAFNAGSELSIDEVDDTLPINRATVNTVICATGGFLSVAFMDRIINKRWRVIPMLCGGLAGCVAVCCSCHTIQPWAAFCIGIFAGLNFMFVSWALRKLKIDDAGDVIGVHWGGGFIGCIGLAFFKYRSGILYSWDRQSGIILAWQLLGFIVISLWSASHTYVIFYILKTLNMVRVDPETEIMGLDYGHGHEIAYPNECHAKANFGAFRSSDKLSDEQRLEKMYDELFEAEIAKYTTDHINKPGWSHPVAGGVLFDLSWISIVRSRRKEMDKRPSHWSYWSSNSNSEPQNVEVQQTMQMHGLENGGANCNDDDNENDNGDASGSLKHRNSPRINHVDRVDQAVNTAEPPRQVDVAINVAMKHRGDWRSFQQQMFPTTTANELQETDDTPQQQQTDANV